MNHPQWPTAGDDQSIAEGSPVTLDGQDSFDIDSDPITYAWVQISGPAVTLTGANTATSELHRSGRRAGGAAGVVATLVFELVVDDGFPPDAPAPATPANVADIVTVDITNMNNLPIADAGIDKTVNENSAVALNGAASSDPDSDTLTYAWLQVGGPTVPLTVPRRPTPSLTTPFVGAGGAGPDVPAHGERRLWRHGDRHVVVHVQNINDPPLASAARPTIACLWPPNHSSCPSVSPA